MPKACRVPSVFLRRALCLLLTVLLIALSGCAGLVPEPVPTATPTPAAPSELPVGAEETPAPPTPSAQPQETEELFFASSPDVACYSEPSDRPECLLGTMKEDTVVTLLEESGAFMRVRWNEGEVWVRSWYMAAKDPEVEAARDAARLAELSATPGFTPFDEPDSFYSTATVLNCREQPNTDCAVLDQILTGTEVTAYGQVNGFCLVRLPSGRLCFCSANYLAGGMLCAVYPGAVDLRALLPRAQFELLFASPNNITGRSLYPAVPLLETYTAGLLYKAYEIFLADGYAMKVYDAYRPISAQFALYDIVQDSRFIGDPYIWGSWHNRGRAVDISLIDLSTGEELEMPTPMHTFDMSASRTRARTWSETAKQNVDYMTKVMTSVGFGIIDTEWWHFEYTGEGNYMPIELNYDTLTYRHVSQYFN